jgi:hypothetical protein
MEEKLMELVDAIDINACELGINTYYIEEFSKKTLIRQYDVELVSIEVENDTVMFIDSNDDIFKCFLVSSVLNVDIMPERYKIIFNNGGYLTLSYCR